MVAARLFLRFQLDTRTRLFKSGIALSFGQLAGKGFGFVSNVIVARILSPEDFGVAATFAATISFIEMLSDLSIGTMVIQSEHGDDPTFVGSVHSLLAIRGVLLSFVLFFLAWPISNLFELHEARWAFQCLAIYPLLKCLFHQDINRLQRNLRFGSSVWCEIGSQAIALLLAFPLASICHNYSALLWLILIQAGANTIITHLVAENLFIFRWNPHFIRSMLRFGWPLLISGIALFIIFQGDAALIGAAPRIFRSAHYQKSDLGMYAVAFNLAQVPALMLTKVIASILLPSLVHAQHSKETFLRRYRFSIEALVLLGGLITIVYTLVGSQAITILYGERYTAGGAVVGWLGAMQSVRLIRRAPTTAALAKADTMNSMTCNLVRLVGFAAAIVAASVGASVVCIAASGLGGEVAALLTSIWRIQRVHGIPARTSVLPLALAFGGVGMTAAIAHASSGSPHLAQVLAMSILACLIFAIACLAALRNLRCECVDITTKALLRLIGQPVKSEVAG